MRALLFPLLLLPSSRVVAEHPAVTPTVSGTEVRGSEAARSTPGAKLDWGRVVRLARGAEDRAGFLRELKRAYPFLFSRKNHLLVRSSDSSCGSEVSGENPRVIQMDPETRTIFAYTNDPDGNCSNMVEVMRYVGDEWRTFKLDFDALKVAKKNEKAHDWKPEEDPASCKRCHGAKVLPIYRKNDTIWPGFYGELDGVLGKGEKAELAKFVGGAAKKEPYSLLEGYSELKADLSNLPKFPGAAELLSGGPGSERVPFYEAFATMDRTIPGAFHKQRTRAR